MTLVERESEDSGGVNEWGSEGALVSALRRGDEAAFAEIVQKYHALMVRVAAAYVPGQDVAEEVAQEAWLGVLNGLDRFEGRSSLKTWIFRILTNIAKTRGAKESRSVPFSSAFERELERDEPAVAADRFRDSAPFEHHWLFKPASWGESPEDRLTSAETQSRVREAISDLPPAQRSVIELRDVHGFSSEEVCNALGLSETNQRVLLHRARAKVRRALEQYFGGE